VWLVALLLLSIAFIVFATAKLQLHPFLALLISAFGFGIASGMSLAQGCSVLSMRGGMRVRYRS
jgi:gluconate:H+ symporter, GntP family